MNNFDLHEQATQLSDTHSGYELARILLQTQDVLKDVVILYCDLVNSGDCGCWNPAEDKAAFCVNYLNGECKWFIDYVLKGELESIEVIGNVNQTPELLEGVS